MRPITQKRIRLYNYGYLQKIVTKDREPFITLLLWIYVASLLYISGVVVSYILVTLLNFAEYALRRD